MRQVVQVPLVPLGCGALLQPAAFLAKHLPASVDRLTPPDYVNQVRGLCVGGGCAT